MNKLIASLIVGAFSAAAFATTPVAPVATPATAAKSETKKVVKEKKAVVKAGATHKVDAAAPATAGVK